MIVSSNWQFFSQLDNLPGAKQLNVPKYFLHNCNYLWCRYPYNALYFLYIIICDFKVPKHTNQLFLYSHENPLEERFWCKSYIFLLFYHTFYFQTYIYFNLSKNLKAIQKQKNSFVKNCLNLFQWKGNFANTYIKVFKHSAFDCNDSTH